jgi:hypothetical protein
MSKNEFFFQLKTNNSSDCHASNDVISLAGTMQTRQKSALIELLTIAEFIIKNCQETYMINSQTATKWKFHV